MGFLEPYDGRWSEHPIGAHYIGQAASMRQAPSNAIADLGSKQPNYVVQITDDEAEGRRELDKFIDPEKIYPVFATTSKFMCTRVDAQTCKPFVPEAHVGRRLCLDMTFQLWPSESGGAPTAFL